MSDSTHTLFLVLNLDCMQASQETVLMVAAREGSMGMVSKMIQHGATVNLKNKVCNSCLGNKHLKLGLQLTA